jgi:hypothetical protein
MLAPDAARLDVLSPSRMVSPIRTEMTSQRCVVGRSVGRSFGRIVGRNLLESCMVAVT